jgi:ribosome biogenesis GTPase
MELEILGWNAHWEELVEPFWTETNLFPARVAFASGGRFRLLGQFGEKPAVLSGRARGAFPQPAVGDWVSASEAPGGTGIVHVMLTRRNRLARGETDRRRGDDSAAAEQVLAANVDRVIIVCGLDTTTPTAPSVGPCASAGAPLRES